MPSSSSSSESEPVLSSGEKPRAWRVLHACERVRSVLLLTEGQLAAGMKPYVITPAGRASAPDIMRNDAPSKASLLNLWQDVRQWRRSILESSPQESLPNQGFELVHAHSFASGMAAVRNCPAVVYDVTTFIENQARPSANGEDESWLGRSFRVAEQFVLTRCGALVVHSNAVKEGAIRRGAAPENVFSIPHPLAAEIFEAQSKNAGRSQPAAKTFNGITILTPEFQTAGANAPAATSSVEMLKMFARIHANHNDIQLLVPAADASAAGSREHAAELGIIQNVHFLPLRDLTQAISQADIVIAPQNSPISSEGESSGPGQNMNLATQALLHGRTLLAADCDENRDLSPDGRGLIWFTAGDLRDLAARLTFLIENADMRSSLAAGGRKFLFETRTPEAIGREYHRVYRHAFSRRRASGTGIASGTARLEPLTASF